MLPEEKRLEALKVVLRAKQHEIDTIASELALIRAQQAELMARIETLNWRRDNESYSPSLEAQPFVASFLEAISLEQASIFRRLSKLDESSKTLEESVNQKFIELQKWKASHDRLKSSIHYLHLRHDNAQMDEIGTNLFYLNRELF